MPVGDWLLVLVIGPPIWVLFGVAGNWVRRYLLGWHLPYEQRLKSTVRR